MCKTPRPFNQPTNLKRRARSGAPTRITLIYTNPLSTLLPLAKRADATVGLTNRETAGALPNKGRERRVAKRGSLSICNHIGIPLQRCRQISS
eukprot:COSAG06_NODE_831_length_12041_cov_5.766789_15_plen_93_part_00